MVGGGYKVRCEFVTVKFVSRALLPHCFAFSRRFLRLFSSGGNQGQVIWLKGDPVAVVGRGRFLAVIYHESNPLPDGTQKLGYTLFDAESSSAIVSGSVSSISSGSQLEWAGFSSDGSLVVMDSDGMVSMLVVTPSSVDAAQYSWDWSPMLDTVGLRKSADDKFWPIAVQDGKLVCVPLKGGNEYPDAGRRPVTTALPFRMPLARSVVEKRCVHPSCIPACLLFRLLLKAYFLVAHVVLILRKFRCERILH